MAHTKYTCPRCGYDTLERNNMRKHFYKRNKICCIKNDIELTDDIKEYVLNNRIYKIPKPIKIVEERFRPNIIDGISSCQYLYLIRKREHVLHNENVYKVGQTIADEYSMTIHRFHSYGKGSEIILIIQCIDCITLEKKLLKVFNETFKKYIFGDEEFVGDKTEMRKIINELVDEEEKEVKEIKDKMNIVLKGLKNKIEIRKTHKYVKYEDELPEIMNNN
jgi:hypothetical protein